LQSSLQKPVCVTCGAGRQGLAVFAAALQERGVPILDCGQFELLELDRPKRRVDLLSGKLPVSLDSLG
jgi:hypothetical protein